MDQQAVAVAQPAAGVARRGYVMAVLTTIYVLSLVDRQIVNILAELIKHDLALLDWQIGAMSGFAFALFYTAAGLPLARLAETGNRVRIIGASLFTWSAFTALSGYAHSFLQLLLARVGVGIGEAGCVPPAHSLIADITPKERRARALASYSMGLPLGSLLGLALGGIVGDAFGWRTAFLLVGLPGVALTLLLLATVRDPRAVIPAARQLPGGITPLREVLRDLWRRRSYVWITAAAVLTAFAGYGSGTFYASFFLRNHRGQLVSLAGTFGLDGPLAFLGPALGLTAGVAGTLGTLAGGHLSDRFARGGAQGYMNVPIVATAVAAPLTVVVLWVSDAVTALAVLAAASFLKSMWFGPVFASIQSLVAPRARATAVATFLLTMNAVGLGAGPIAVGGLSDLLRHRYGPDEGLRFAMMALAVVVVASAACFARARRTLGADTVS